mmetsp:Transcript_948/g.2453  ORF Transcript_948/g.2453 Transcript_948/m.2453 type:complete len:226 (+) Transcript_948:1061-1738(+)
MSSSLIARVGSRDSRPLTKMSWSTKWIRAPPSSELVDKSSLLPTTDLVNPAAYPCSFSSTMALCLPTSSGRPSPRDLSSRCASALRVAILSESAGRSSAMWSARMRDTDHPSASVPHLSMTSAYAGWCRKNSASEARASRIDRRCAMSCWHRFTTPMYPSRSGTTSPRMHATASVPRSMMSSLVTTPMVRLPMGSTSLDSVSASELARSVLAGETARMRHDSRLM